MSALVPNVWSRTEAVRRARAILSGDVGVLEGCIPLASLAHDVVPDWSEDPDFRVFGVLASEIDRFPFGSVRELWNPEALARLDVEIERIAEAAREEILTACRNVIVRFESTESAGQGGNGAV